ncbi:MAG: hemolysin family protein [Spirochaetales bacterium]|nr:hemolysin family protein [Spirochaetales bacterium]
MELILILALILLNGLFSLSEMALVSSRKARLKSEADKGRKSYAAALRTLESPSRYLSTIQVAITLIGILTGAVSGATVSQRLAAWFSTIPWLARSAESLAVGLVVVVVTMLSVVLGELVPKTIALRHPESLAAFASRPLRVLTMLFYPVVRLLSAITDAIIRLLGMSRKTEPEVTAEEVRILVEQGEQSGVFEHEEREMVEGVLSLDDRRVTMFMTPRTEIQAVDLEEPLEKQIHTVLDAVDYNYLPVVEGDIDRVAGLLPVRTALKCLAEGEPLDVRSCMEQPLMIPETVSGLQALGLLRKAHRTAGLIVDEFGGISGIVTIGDLLDLVVDLPAAGQEETSEIFQRSDGSYLVDGSMAIADFAKSIGLGVERFEPEEYDTVAGFVLHCAGAIPKAGDIVEWPPLRIEVVDMDGKRIDKVLVRIETAPGETD